jgi:hypothetical protein
MALPQRNTAEDQSPNTYQYQVRNAKKIDKKRLNTDFQYLNNEDFSSANADPRLLSSENPTLRTKEALAAKQAVNDSQHYKLKQPQPVEAPTRNTRKKVLSLRNTKKVLRSTKSTAVSSSIVAWGMSLWVIQVIFALLGIIFLATVGGVDAIANSDFVQTTLDRAANAPILGGVIQAGRLIVSAVDSQSLATGFYLLLYMIVLAIGLFTLGAASFQYMVSLINPLSGDNGGAKMNTFLLAILGYATPFLNLFPWFLIYIAVVWKYPK